MSKPTREEAEKAVHTLLRWAGDDPAREGLADTPACVVKAFEDWFSGYDQDPEEYLTRTFEEIEGYDDMVILKATSVSRAIASIIWRPSSAVPMSVTCRQTAWSATPSWPGWWKLMPGGFRCRKK